MSMKPFAIRSFIPRVILLRDIQGGVPSRDSPNKFSSSLYVMVIFLLFMHSWFLFMSRFIKNRSNKPFAVLFRPQKAFDIAISLVNQVPDFALLFFLPIWISPFHTAERGHSRNFPRIQVLQHPFTNVIGPPHLDQPGINALTLFYPSELLDRKTIAN